MATINNYGSKIGRQVGNPGWFNNVNCTIGEQVVNNSRPNVGGKKQNKEKDLEGFEKRMQELAGRMRKLKKL